MKIFTECDNCVSKKVGWVDDWVRGSGHVLFNDALNTFYLRLYGIRHMVKDRSDREETYCCHMGYSFWLAARTLLYAPTYRHLYGFRHMVKDHSDSEKGNPLLPHGLLFLISYLNDLYNISEAI